MKRLPGIVISAVVLVLGSVLHLLMSGLMAFAGAVVSGQHHSGMHAGAPPAPPMAPWMPVIMYVMAAFFLALGAWGILTAIGLFRLRRWARYSVLVIGGGLALFGLTSMLMMLMLTIITLPLPPTMDVSQAHTVHTMMRAMFGVISVFYAIMCGIGIWWLVYFNWKKVREVFAGVPGQFVESPRPLLISVLAVLSMIGGPICLLIVFLPLPGLIFGFTLHGWERNAVYLVFACLATAAGVGLWRLKEWGRLLAIVMQVVALAQYVVFLVRPSLMTDYTAKVNQGMNIGQTAPPQLQSMFYLPIFGFGILFVLSILWVLVHYRGAFADPTVPAQIESSAQAD